MRGNIQNFKSEIFEENNDKGISLNKITTYKTLSANFRESIDELLELKRKGLNNNKDIIHTKNLIVKAFTNIANCRINHRELYLDIEKNRIKTQIEKEKIDQLANYQESLVYQKNNIQREIFACKNLELPELSKLPELAKKIEVQEDDLDENNFAKFQDSMLNDFSEELDQRKKIKLEYEEKENLKQVITREYDNSQQFLNKLPSIVNKISEACKPLQTLYKVSASTQYDQIMLSKKLPKPLLNIYLKFALLKKSKLDDNIEIEIKESQNKVDSTELQFDKMILNLTIFNDAKEDEDLKKYIEIADDKTASTITDLFPLKFSLVYIHDYSVVLMTLDNNNYFISDEILSQLIEGESGTKIIYDPKNENERNINNKYSLFKWLQKISDGDSTLIYSVSDPHILKAQDITKGIRERIRTLLFIKYQIDFLKRNRNISGRILEQLRKQFPWLAIPTKNSGLDISDVIKISHNEFLKLIEIPNILMQEKKMDIEDLNPQKDLFFRIKEIKNDQKQISYVGKYGHDVNEEAYQRYTGIPKYEKNANQQEDIYKLEVQAHKLKLIILININHNYPKTAPRFYVVCKSFEERGPEIPEEIRSKFHKSAEYPINLGGKYKESKSLPKSLIQDIERDLNAPVTLENHNLLFSFQIIRLMNTILTLSEVMTLVKRDRYIEIYKTFKKC